MSTFRQNPYVGLRPFGEDDARVFFGRDGQVDPLIDLLAAHRFAAVVGVSGSGKSSLARAGLVPALHGGALPTGQREWVVLEMKPRSQPVRYLAEALAQTPLLQELSQDDCAARAAFAEAALLHSSSGLVDLVLQSLVEGRKYAHAVLVLVDQFEEIFRFARLGSSEEADHFVRLLLMAADQREVPVHVVITMRSDFLGECARFRGLPEHLNRGQYLIPRLERHDLRQAIEGPARLAGCELDPALVTRLLNDVGEEPNRLPLLQHALRRLWTHWQALPEAPPAIGLDLYVQGVGTLDGTPKTDTSPAMPGVLHRHAQEVFTQKVPPAQRTLIARLFKALTEMTPDLQLVRRPESAGKLAALLWPDLKPDAALAALADLTEPFRLEDPGFLTPSSPPNVLKPDTIMDISHESLMSHWHTLGKWVRREAEDARQIRRLADDEERGLHYDDMALSKIERWWRKTRPTLEWTERHVPSCWNRVETYLRNERAAARQRLAQQEAAARAKRLNALILKGLLTAFVVVLVGGLLFSVWMFLEARSARQSAQKALSQSFDRIIGRNGELSQIEIDTLWELAELTPENEEVRTLVLNQWVNAEDPLPALMQGEAGLHAAVGLDKARRKDRELAGQLVKELENPQEIDVVRFSFLASSLAELAGKLDAAAAAPLLQRGVERLAKALENPQETDSSSLSRLASSLAALAGKIDAAVAAPLAERLVKALENGQETDLFRLSSLAWSLAALAEKLNAAAAAPLLQRGAERLVKALENVQETDLFRLSSLVESLAALAEKLDAAVAAPLLQRVAQRVVKELEKPRQTDWYSLSRLAESLAALAGNLDAEAAGPLAERLVKALENPQETDVERFSPLASSLAALAGNLDAAAAGPLAERLVKALENGQETDSRRLSSLAEPLSALAGKLDAAAAGPLAERLVKALENVQETDSRRLPSLAEPLSALAGKLDAAAAAPLLQRGAERLVKALESPQETDSRRLSRLALSLAALAGKLDAAAAAPFLQKGAERLDKALKNVQETDSLDLSSLASSLSALAGKPDAAAAAPLLQTGAERVVKALENLQETDYLSLSRLASSLSALAGKIDGAAAAPLAERVVKALENAQETDMERVSSLASSLSALAGRLDAAETRSAILLKALAAGISKWRGSLKAPPDGELLIHLCDGAQALPDEASRQVTIQFMVQQLRSSDIPELENEEGPVIEPQGREIVRKACLRLSVPQLANLLKAPFCRGELQKLVLLALEQQKDCHFDGDLWKFVEAAATECYAGVDLDGPVKRIRLEEVIAEVSKHVPIPEAKPKAETAHP